VISNLETVEIKTVEIKTVELLQRAPAIALTPVHHRVERHARRDRVLPHPPNLAFSAGKPKFDPALQQRPASS